MPYILCMCLQKSRLYFKRCLQNSNIVRCVGVFLMDATGSAPSGVPRTCTTFTTTPFFLMNQQLKCLTCNKFSVAAALELGSSLFPLPRLCLLLLGHPPHQPPLSPHPPFKRLLAGFGWHWWKYGRWTHSSGVDLNC